MLFQTEQTISPKKIFFCSPGLYLFLQVQFPLSLVSIKYKQFIMFGCGKENVFWVISFYKWFYSLGGPLINMAIWVGLRILTYDSNGNEDIIKNCPFIETNEVDFIVFEIPIFFILICNTFFLIWIMVVCIKPESTFCQIAFFRLSLASYVKKQLWIMTRNTGKQQRWKTTGLLYFLLFYGLIFNL